MLSMRPFFQNLPPGFIFALLCLIPLFWPLYAHSEELEQHEETPPDTAAEEDILDSTHRFISEQFLYLPNAIDSFFADRRLDLESNESRLRFTMDSTIGKGGEWSFVTNLNARVVLPYAEKKLKITFESAPTTGITNPEGEAGETNVIQSVEKGEQAATLEARLSESDNWFFHFNVGLKLHTPVDPFTRLRARRDFPYTFFRLRLTETIFLFKSLGLGETTQFDVDVPLGPRELFRATSFATYYNTDDRFVFGQDFNIFLQLTNNRALAYRFGVRGNNETSTRVTEYIADIRFRKRLHKDWLFMELIPELRFPIEEDFRLTPAFTVRLETIFGDI